MDSADELVVRLAVIQCLGKRARKAHKEHRRSSRCEVKRKRAINWPYCALTTILRVTPINN